MYVFMYLPAFLPPFFLPSLPFFVVPCPMRPSDLKLLGFVLLPCTRKRKPLRDLPFLSVGVFCSLPGSCLWCLPLTWNQCYAFCSFSFLLTSPQTMGTTLGLCQLLATRILWRWQALVTNWIGVAWLSLWMFGPSLCVALLAWLACILLFPVFLYSFQR